MGGFNQAIELASAILKNVKFIQEKKLISKFLEEVAQDSGRYCFGIKETMQGLDAGAVETLIVWENFDMVRLVIRNPHTETIETKILTKEEMRNPKLYKDPETNVDLVID